MAICGLTPADPADEAPGTCGLTPAGPPTEGAACGLTPAGAPPTASGLTPGGVVEEEAACGLTPAGANPASVQSQPSKLYLVTPGDSEGRLRFAYSARASSRLHSAVAASFVSGATHSVLCALGGELAGGGG